MSRPRVTALIHTRNEADQIEACLEAIAWADEILLLDDLSSDGTPEIVRTRFPQARVEVRKSHGSAAQKNYGIDQASHDWIFVIDADERATPELRDEIIRTLERGPSRWAYSIGRRNFILGEEVRHSGLQRDRVTRLFHRRHARYPNRRVHADLVVDGEPGRLKEKYIHFYVRSFDHMIEKMTRYGMWGAAQLFAEGKRLEGPWPIASHTLSRFFRDYILNLGLLDGTRGLIAVGLHVYYTFWKYTKLWEFTLLEKRGIPVPLPEMEGDEALWARPWENS